MTQLAARKKRRRKAPVMAAPRRRRATHHHKAPVKRRRRLSAGGGITGGIKGAIGTGFKGGLGGALHVAPKFVTKLDTMFQIGWDLVGVVGLSMMKQPQMAAGFAGAAVSNHMQEVFKKSMNDELHDHHYVDPNMLSDSGFQDEFGDPIHMDDDGELYALSDMGDYEHIGHMNDLQGGMNDTAGINGVSMVPLQDPYALSHGNPYALQDQY